MNSTKQHNTKQNRRSAAPHNDKMKLPSPLKKYLQHHISNSSCRTGYTHLYSGLNPSINRSSVQSFRQSIRTNQFNQQTSGQAPGYVQANFVALPKLHAFDFLNFCLKNPKPCPLLAVTDAGSFTPSNVALNSDLRTDIPMYRLWENGLLTNEMSDINHLWNQDMVGFLLGCSFSWEHVLSNAGYCPKHIVENKNVPMYRTNIKNQISGPFGGELVVSMRPYKPCDIEAIARITGCYPGAHGGPIHWGDPKDIGVNVNVPDWGDAVTISNDEIPVFWACGVTPHTAIMDAKLPMVVTHAPGHMFICDIKDEELYVETDFEDSYGR